MPLVSSERRAEIRAAAADAASDVLSRHFANQPMGLNSILGHLLQLTVENQLLLEEIMSEQSDIDAQTAAISAAEQNLTKLLGDVNTHIGSIQSEVQNLKGQGVNTAALDAAVGNLAAVVSAAQSADTAAAAADTAAAPAPAPAPAPAAPATPAPAPGPAPTGGTAAMDPANNKPLYSFTGTGTPDTTVWSPSVDVAAAGGATLYTFNNDTPGGQPTGTSAEWQPYTGATQPVSA